MSTWSKYKGLHFQTYDRYFLFTDQSMVISVGANEYADIELQVFNVSGSSSVVVNFGSGHIAQMVDAAPFIMGPGTSGLFEAPKSVDLGNGLIIVDVWRYAPNQIYDT